MPVFLCASDAKAATTGIMGLSWGAGSCLSLAPDQREGHGEQGPEGGGSGGWRYIDLISFMASDFMLHDMLVLLSDVFSAGVLFLFVILLSTHPSTVAECVWKKDIHGEKERDTGLSQTTSIMTPHRYLVM